MSERCSGVGTCTLPKGHAGLCLYHRHDPEAPPATLPSGEATVGIKDGQIVVDFGATGTWQWVKFTPAQAAHFGELLIRMAVRGGVLTDGGPPH